MNGSDKGLRWISLGLATAFVGAFSIANWVSAADTKVAKTTPNTPAATSTDEATAAKLGAARLSQLIDSQIQKRLDAESIKASAKAEDAEFLRRVYLDITGAIPPADKVAAFLDSKDANKRSTVIDELLASSDYGHHMADIWQAMLLPRVSDNRRLQSAPMVSWLEKEFNSNKPWDKLVTDLLTASGPQDKNGAVTFFLANPTADKVTDTVSKLFLGLQLQCAQCHNHPFTGWKQTEYWGMATFFTKVRADNVNKAAKTGTTAGVNEGGNGRQPKLPESAKVVPAKFLLGEQPKISSSEPYRPVLAKWLTSSDNPFFAKAMVNRMWFQFFGHGFVTPVDDMHDANPASHPELLKELAAQFTASDFDVKFLIRAICNSEAYQRTSKPTAENESDTTLFSHMAVKVMSPEQLYDSLATVVGKAEPQRGGARFAAGKYGSGDPRSQFVLFFQGEENADPTDYQSGIPQALRLMNAPQFNITPNMLNQITKGEKNPAEVIERLYLKTLARRPTAEETQHLTEYLAKHSGNQGYADIVWVLLNSSEFTVNH